MVRLVQAIDRHPKIEELIIEQDHDSCDDSNRGIMDIIVVKIDFSRFKISERKDNFCKWQRVFLLIMPITKNITN